MLSTFHHTGGEYLDELKIGGDRAHEINASNGQDFTYRQNDHRRFVSVYRPFASVVVRFVFRAARRSPYR